MTTTLSYIVQKFETKRIGTEVMRYILNYHMYFHCGDYRFVFFIFLLHVTITVGATVQPVIQSEGCIYEISQWKNSNHFWTSFFISTTITHPQNCCRRWPWLRSNFQGPHADLLIDNAPFTYLESARCIQFFLYFLLGWLLSNCNSEYWSNWPKWPGNFLRIAKQSLNVGVWDWKFWVPHTTFF